MNIVQVARRFTVNDWGGMETVIIETSKQLIRMGHRTEILCTLATANSKSDNVEGVPVRRVPYFYPYFGLREEAKRILDRKGGSPFSFTMLQALKRYPNLDLIHLHAGGRLGGIGRHVARKRRIPYVVSLHGAKFDVPPEEAASWVAPTKGTIEWGKVLGWWVGARQVLHDAAAILCVGHRDSVLAQQKLPEKRVVYLPNGVDAERFAAGDGSGFRARHGIPPKALVVLTAARIDVQKNQHFVARVLPGLARICPEVHALIIGHVTNEAYYDELVKLIASRNMQSRATIIRGLAGRGQELVDAYHAADLFVLPSIHEPFGIVILEAWASGLPVIASRVGGIPTFVEHDVDGMLFRPGDEKAFLDAFRALSTRERRETMARAGQRKAIKEYSWDKITERLVGIYEEVLRENPLRK